MFHLPTKLPLNPDSVYHFLNHFFFELINEPTNWVLIPFYPGHIRLVMAIVLFLHTPPDRQAAAYEADKGRVTRVGKDKENR